jgi:single-stranded-DNA-specific exonuclease
MQIEIPPFLGVRRSVTGRRWRDRLDGPAMARAEEMAALDGVQDVLARVLAARGVSSATLTQHLEPRLRDLLPDPSTLRDMDAAAARLADAVERREQVAVFGDYDVDGACSAALVAGIMGRLGARPRIYIPDRITEGYGPNVEAIRTLATEGASLLVAVDCGTVSHEPFAEAARLGLDVVVLDHHQAPPDLPPVQALVNPNRQDDVSGLGHLCAAGVVFVAMVALNRELRRRAFYGAVAEPDLMGELDLVALATVADVVPLIGLNRAFVRQGLAIMRERRRLGLSSLIETARLTGPLAPWHLGFTLGPRINAGGRIGDASLGAKLLLEQDEDSARRIAAELDTLNAARQDIERLAVEEACALAEATLMRDPDQPILCLASSEWHPGIVGLIAARLKERFGRPAFALALGEEGRATGSGRSIPGVDLGLAVRAAVSGGLALKGGGHAMAAGVTIEAARLDAFREGLSIALAQQVAIAREDRSLSIDAALTAGAARPALLVELEKAGPFGSGAPEPVFAFPAHRIVEAGLVGSGGHVRFRAKAGEETIGGIMFRAAETDLGRAILGAQGESLHLAGSLNLDHWGGNARVELRLIDAAKP